MDHISAVASVISLISTGEHIVHLFGAIPSSAAVQKERLMLEVHIGILDEISQLTLDSNVDLPRTAQSCVQLCSARLVNVGENVLNVRENVLRKHFAPPIITSEKDLKKTIAKFAESVQLYRNVVMEYETLEALDLAEVVN